MSTAPTTADKAWLKETVDAIELDVRRFFEGQGVRADVRTIQAAIATESVKQLFLQCRQISRRVAELEQRGGEN